MLRATQSHQLLLMVVRQLARLPVIPVPSGPTSIRSTPARWVYELADLVRGSLQASGRSQRLVSVQPPGDAADTFGLAPTRP
jgi:hypothetical protein